MHKNVEIEDEARLHSPEVASAPAPFEVGWLFQVSRMLVAHQIVQLVQLQHRMPSVWLSSFSDRQFPVLQLEEQSALDSEERRVGGMVKYALHRAFVQYSGQNHQGRCGELLNRSFRLLLALGI